MGKMGSMCVTRTMVADQGSCAASDGSASVGSESESEDSDAEGALPFDDLLLERLEEPQAMEPWRLERPSLAQLGVVKGFAERSQWAPPREPVPYSSVAAAAQIAVEVRALAFDSCDIEPLFGTLFLFNKTTSSVTSEPFRFCLAPEQTNLVVGLTGDTKARATAVFTIPLPETTVDAADSAPFPSPTSNNSSSTSSSGNSGSSSSRESAPVLDDYLVLRVDKVAQDDALAAVADVYSKRRRSTATSQPSAPTATRSSSTQTASASS